jgi:serine/threonine protein kinase
VIKICLLAHVFVAHLICFNSRVRGTPNGACLERPRSGFLKQAVSRDVAASLSGNHIGGSAVSTCGSSALACARRSLSFVSHQFLVKESFLPSFEREIRIFETLDHVNVIKFQEVVHLPGAVGVMTPHCEREDLLDHLFGRVKLSEPRASVIFRRRTDTGGWTRSAT